jgi:hypothetical protein
MLETYHGWLSEPCQPLLGFWRPPLVAIPAIVITNPRKLGHVVVEPLEDFDQSGIYPEEEDDNQNKEEYTIMSRSMLSKTKKFR